jgi:hypothetical protein
MQLIIMADAAGDHDEIFVYMGGEQQVPVDVSRVRIHKSVKIIPDNTFRHRRRLASVEFHDGVERIGRWAFHDCVSLRGVKLLGVIVIEFRGFSNCEGLTDVDFGDKLETIEFGAFCDCESLTNIKMPSVRSIQGHAFSRCLRLTVFKLPEVLETIGDGAFYLCYCLQRIAMPLKRRMIAEHVFLGCENLTTVDLVLVGGTNKTISSLHLDRWRKEMNEEINRINQVLPTTSEGTKTHEISQWIDSVIQRLEHYKAVHHALLMEAMTLLELALWKAKIHYQEKETFEGVKTSRKNKIDVQSERGEGRVTCGADIVIKNVLPFLQLM